MQAQWNKPVRYIVFGVAFLLLCLGFWYIRSVLEPLVIAAFIAYLINPAVNFLTQTNTVEPPGGGQPGLFYYPGNFDRHPFHPDPDLL